MSEPRGSAREVRTRFLDYTANRAPRAGAVLCVCCMKPLAPGKPRRYVEMLPGEPFVIHPDDVAVAPEHVKHPIGNDCARRLGLEWTTDG